MKRDHVRDIIGRRINTPTLPVDDTRCVALQAARMKTIPKMGITVD
jgi:hypothetical protein